jgi:hypothetical protein
MTEPGVYSLNLNFVDLEDQRELLRQLSPPLSFRNQFLMRGLIRLIDEIIHQEKTGDTSIGSRTVTTDARMLTSTRPALTEKPAC